MEFEFSKEKTALPRRAMSKDFQISDLVDFKDLLMHSTFWNSDTNSTLDIFFIKFDLPLKGVSQDSY